MLFVRCPALVPTSCVSTHVCVYIYAYNFMYIVLQMYVYIHTMSSLPRTSPPLELQKSSFQVAVMLGYSTYVSIEHGAQVGTSSGFRARLST